MNPPPRDDTGPNFVHLLRRLDNDARVGDVRVLFDRPYCDACVQFADQQGRRVRRMWADGLRRFQYNVMSADDGRQYSALLDFLATGQYRWVQLDLHNNMDDMGRAVIEPPLPPGRMMTMMEDILNAMNANQQPVPAELKIRGWLCLTMPILHRALQYPNTLLVRSRMESAPLQPQQLVLPNDTTEHNNEHPAASATAVRSRPERGTTLRYSFIGAEDWPGILQAATTLETNVTSLMLDFNDPIESIDRILDLSSWIGSFVAAQPNGMDLTICFRSNQMDGDVIVIVERILADVSTQCPGVHSLLIRIHDDVRFTRVQYLPRRLQLLSDSLLQLLSDSALTRFEFRETLAILELREEPTLDTSVFSQEQEQRMTVMIQRNTVIPVYLQTTYLLKPRRPRVVDPIIDPPIVVYANDGEDRRKHQFVLSHALSEAAVHPIFFSHFYEFVRNHSNELPGGRDDRRQATAAAAAVARPPPGDSSSRRTTAAVKG
jgi:hypothetical protein